MTRVITVLCVASRGKNSELYNFENYWATKIVSYWNSKFSTVTESSNFTVNIEAAVCCLALYILRVCQCYSCVATITSDINCRSDWAGRGYTYSSGGTNHASASTLAECQAACEFEPRCVAVDWRSSDYTCQLYTNPDHGHYPTDLQGDHYDLVSRCNSTVGQCFYSNYVGLVTCIIMSHWRFLFSSSDNYIIHGTFLQSNKKFFNYNFIRIIVLYFRTFPQVFTAVRGDAMASRPSVCPAEMLRCDYHIGWNTLRKSFYGWLV